MIENQKTCLYCNRSQVQTPLIAVYFQDSEHFICPQHLPLLIHKPEQLEKILPGISSASTMDVD